MTRIRHNQDGFSPVEIGLVVVLVALIGLVGWSVYHTRQTSNKALDAAASTSNGAGPRFVNNSKSSPAVSGDTSNASLQKDLSSATSANGQSSQDMTSTNNSLNDQSTLTSVPQ